ncbi:BZ3500_MvSof-1268-A1-R1_Chr9g10896 [Microbotryum saponariae]|uniref:BZ3500_MvSof-1268-A1-R1_Chr9g10896 protein n=1 Tax=Microbotryum saponariae TaxID=289078 RepID=A0A2X0KCJ4_9BASI|nr:BZ3501_MvSof-1269-A2-R1_Chr9g10644 [Microbotryum saponariae]SDA00879.1 BZ3500_MvSof-1268-A1-R1_Chr9g10896 [Microbotryum saponariae]
MGPAVARTLAFASIVISNVRQDRGKAQADDDVPRSPSSPSMARCPTTASGAHSSHHHRDERDHFNHPQMMPATASNPARESVIEALISPALDCEDDQCFIEEKIVSRVVVCDTPGLVYSVSRMEQARFKARVQEVQKRLKRVLSRLRDEFRRIQTRLPTTREPNEGRLGVATCKICEFRWRTAEEFDDCTSARAQEHPRLTQGGARHKDFKRSQPHHFLTCCEQMAAKKKGPTARGMLRTACVSSPLVELVLDLAQHALSQPTRMYAPGLAITDTKVYLVVLDHEACRIATIADCWGERFGESGVVLFILFGLDVYSAGFNPLFRYACHSQIGIVPASSLASCLRPPELEEGAPLVGRTVDFIDEEAIELVHPTLTDGGSIFSRSTVVLQLTRPSLIAPAGSASSPSHSTPSFVLKIQYNTLNYVGHEANVLQKIEERCASIASQEEASLIFNHIALLEKWKSFGLHYSQIQDKDLPVLRDGQDAYQRVRRRKLDLLILRNPTPLPTRVHGHRHCRHPLSDAFDVLDRLFTLLPVLYDLGIHHRDLSLGNILHHQGHLATGTRASLRRRVVTLDTAPSDVLLWLLVGREKTLAYRSLQDDLESAVYWFVQVVGSFAEFLSPRSWEAWKPLYLASTSALPGWKQLFNARLDLWGSVLDRSPRRRYLLEALHKLSPRECRLVNMLTLRLPDFPQSPDGIVRIKAMIAMVQTKMREILGYRS